MKFKLILITTFFFFALVSFGQVDSNSIQLDSVVVIKYKRESQTTTLSLLMESCGPMDTSSMVTKKNGNILVECYNKVTQIRKSRTLLKSNSRWDKIVKKATWDQNGKILVKYVYREKHITSDPFDIVPGRNGNSSVMNRSFLLDLRKQRF